MVLKETIDEQITLAKTKTSNTVVNRDEKREKKSHTVNHPVSATKVATLKITSVLFRRHGDVPKLKKFSHVFATRGGPFGAHGRRFNAFRGHHHAPAQKQQRRDVARTHFVAGDFQTQYFETRGRNWRDIHSTIARKRLKEDGLALKTLNRWKWCARKAPEIFYESCAGGDIGRAGEGPRCESSGKKRRIAKIGWVCL
ncbi:hypothetical protein TcasGA2_TC013233 [Tribolium castaneum]|uniref:Uncharacterized protein n=1 Tax=Tribolium castaneum TaxID=7070 RepID=D6WMI4_TRICA|nr:hypothetical protein TcasGA2_TC013233 [Tribolium castaneum]